MSNKIYVNNKIDKNFIDMCDKEFDKKLSLAAGAVFTGKEKIIGLSGPTCSGKLHSSSRRSARVDLPWSMWAMIEKFLILERSVISIPQLL